MFFKGYIIIFILLYKKYLYTLYCCQIVLLRVSKSHVILWAVSLSHVLAMKGKKEKPEMLSYCPTAQCT